ncbi:MAG TPA: NAD-dependent epimerase/dehydratase family protein [Phormidium sp.]
MKVLVTGSSGLIGSEAVEFYDHEGHQVFGVDNNMRSEFFGKQGDTLWNLNRLTSVTKNFQHHSIDIRDREKLFDLFRTETFDLIIHCAAQPSHDKACQIPLLDFEVNALGTVNLLEATRLHCPEAVFIHISTNKVYGDAPNEVPRIELEKRYDYANPDDYHGISEECRIDRCLHSLFGASKTAGDVVAQEYGRYFGMNVGIFRGGCLTGPSHSGVELHGFLSYLVKVAVTGGTYKVFGYKGKQVRDNIHSYDVIQAFEAFRANPKPGEVYNLGGGRENSVSILEAFDLVNEITGRKIDWVYVDQNRIGDHICYISDLRKLKTHFPEWKITRSLPNILEEMVQVEKARYE